MQFRCIEYHRQEDGAFWQVGEVYEFTRQDLLRPDAKEFLAHFEAVNDTAKTFVEGLQ